MPRAQKPLQSGKFLSTHPKSHLHLGVFSPTRIAILANINLRFAAYYFLRCFQVNKYFWAHRFHKGLENCLAWYHLRTIKESVFTTTSGGIPEAGQSCSTSLGEETSLSPLQRKVGLRAWSLKYVTPQGTSYLNLLL